jgi:hypothetical protein
LRLPNGSQLRGIEVMEGLYIARDHKFYLMGKDRMARHIGDRIVWKQCSFTSLVAAVRRIAEARAITKRTNPDTTSC